MIAQLSLYTLKPDLSGERLEEMMWLTRTTLLKIPEILALRTGKRIKPEDPWDWFVFLEADTLDKLAIAQDDAHYFKFLQEVIHPSVAKEEVHVFEMDPRKDVKYS
jgi:hypothetical protein